MRMLLDKVLACNLFPRSSPSNVDIDFIPVLSEDREDIGLRVVMVTVLGDTGVRGVRYRATNLSPAHEDGYYMRSGGHPDYNVRIE